MQNGPNQSAVVHYLHSCPSMHGEWIPTAIAMGVSSRKNRRISSVCVRVRLPPPPFPLVHVTLGMD